MKIQERIFAFIVFFVLPSLACQAVTGTVAAIIPSPATLIPTGTPFPPSVTPASSETYFPPTATASPSTTPIPPTATIIFTQTSNPSASPIHFQVFEELWQTVNDNYLYPDYNGLDWNAIYLEYDQRISKGMRKDEFYLAMGEMVHRLGDEHSIYFNPTQAAEKDAEYAGEYDYVGIGILSTVIPERNLITIVFTFPGSPAAQAGLKWHDNILAVDSYPIFDESGYRRDLLRGPEGSLIELTVQSPGQEPRQVTIKRSHIEGPLPVPHQVLISPSGNRIGYILIVTFGDSNTDEQIAEAIREMTREAPLNGMILDNRHNKGGSSEVLANTLAYFCDGIVGWFVEQKAERPLEIQGKDINGSQSIPLAVLIGEGTASFGEIFAGLLKDIGRAALIGEQTNGNVEILSVYNFSDGSRAWIALSTFRPLNHPEQDWEQSGISPDLIVSSNWDQATLEKEAIIQAALSYFDTIAASE